MLAPNIIAILPTLTLGNENSKQESNSMPQPIYLYLSRSAFLVSFTDQNKQLPNVKSVFKSIDHGRKRVRNIQIYYLFRNRKIIIY